MPATDRPAPTTGLSPDEFLRWYWLKDELTAFARLLGIRTTGGKEVLTARIAAALGGRTFAEPPPARGAAAAQLSGELTADTVIPRGQRCSQAVRAWFTEAAGPGFRFDAEMRDFFAASDGTRTLRDALEHWNRTRGQGERPIDPQFEYNRFTRAWHEQHPDGTREQLLVAWREYRRRPVDARGRA